MSVLQTRSEAVAAEKPLIEIAFTWTDSDPKGKPFTATNGGDDEARNVQIQPLNIGKHQFTFGRVPQLLPGRSADREPQPGDTMGMVFRTVIDALEMAITDRALELKTAIPSTGSTLEQFSRQFGAEKAARDEFEHIPLSVTFEDRRGRVTALEYRLVTYVFARAQSAELQLVHEVQMTGRPNPLPPLRVDAVEALRTIEAKRAEGAHLFDDDHRFTSPMQDRFFEWLKSTGAELERLYWSDDVAKWFRTGTLWMAGGYGGTIETRDDRLKVLDQILEEVNMSAAPVPAAPHEFEYDVCLSFAGEQREYVEGVYNALKSRSVRVFYDKAEQAKLWGKDLYEHLNEVYRDRARYCVMFISKEYAQKQWTSLERKGAQARVFRENREYILPARFDATEIPGINETVGYINLCDLNPDQLADLIVQKLGNSAADDVASQRTDAGSSTGIGPRFEDLQSTMRRLEERDAPRQLTSNQIDRLLSELAKLEPQPIAVTSAGNDSEADRFRDQIGEAFRSAGWSVDVRTAAAAMDVEGVSLDYFSGHLRTTTPTADTIRFQTALERANVAVRPRSLPEDEHEFHWMLSVGHKPRT